MKIKCEYCGSMISDTVDRCPSCGAPNTYVRRATGDQPKTIEELKQWYADKNLPAPDVTRFFIGIDYKFPKAFGIYQDENTGNFVVYKNKASGERAVRYEGTDEAYAVNELYQRLKEEIIQQKMQNTKKKEYLKGGSRFNQLPGFLRSLIGILGVCLGTSVLGFVLIMVIGGFITLNEPKDGYYDYQNTVYYRTINSFDDAYWYQYQPAEQDWSAPLSDWQMPELFQKRKTSKPYYKGDKWDASLGCTDFTTSLSYRDYQYGIFPSIGYYRVNDKIYYHLAYRYNEQWYVWNNQWEFVPYHSLPYELQHTSLTPDHFLGDVYDPALGTSDFRDTIYYKDYHASSDIDKGYYMVDNVPYYHLTTDYTDGWYTYSDDWHAIDYDSLPEEFTHPSTIGDFYYTPTWDSSTQFTDFEDTPLYYADKDNWSNSSSDDNDYSWDSDDSWDSDSSDWDSDW